MSNKLLNFQLDIVLIKEGKAHVAYLPALDLSTHGESVEDALKAGTEVARIFLQEIMEMGTVEEVLLDLGWQKNESQKGFPLMPPEVIHATRSINVSCHA